MARVRIFQRLVPLRRDTVQRLEGNKKASHEDRYLQEECSRKSVSSVAQSCLTLCDPVDCSTPGLPVHQQLLEFTQTHVR